LLVLPTIANFKPWSGLSGLALKSIRRTVENFCLGWQAGASEDLHHFKQKLCGFRKEHSVWNKLVTFDYFSCHYRIMGSKNGFWINGCNMSYCHVINFWLHRDFSQPHWSPWNKWHAPT
jgi:hypothetical protein